MWIDAGHLFHRSDIWKIWLKMTWYSKLLNKTQLVTFLGAKTNETITTRHATNQEYELAQSVTGVGISIEDWHDFSNVAELRLNLDLFQLVIRVEIADWKKKKKLEEKENKEIGKMTALQINYTSHKILVDCRKEKYDFHSFCLRYCSIGITFLCHSSGWLITKLSNKNWKLNSFHFLK